MSRHRCSVGPGRCPHWAVRELGGDGGGPFVCAEHLGLAMARQLGMAMELVVAEHRRILEGKEAEGIAGLFAGPLRGRP